MYRNVYHSAFRTPKLCHRYGDKRWRGTRSVSVMPYDLSAECMNELANLYLHCSRRDNSIYASFNMKTP